MQTPQFISDPKGNFYVPFETDLVSGYLPVDIPKLKGEPTLRWRGPKIDLETEWYPATAFMYDFQKHEVVLRLFVTADRSRIIIRPMTQVYGTGMSVKEAPTKEDREEIVVLGLIDIGSVHSHCTAKAFASGTDTEDERNWPGGLHITIGNLDEKQYDIHARFAWDIPGLEEGGKVVRKAQRILQLPNLWDWFELPEHAAKFCQQEEGIADQILRYFLCKPMDAEYPESWKEKLIDPPKAQVVTYGVPGHGMISQGMFPDEVMYFKKPKKGKKGNGVEDFERRRWACWQNAMEIIREVPEARQLHWTVDDFKPELRHKLIGFFPQAEEIWKKIEAELKKFNLSEIELFGPWQWG